MNKTTKIAYLVGNHISRDDFCEAMMALSNEGYIIVTGLSMNPKNIEQKILMSDAVFVINPENGYDVDIINMAEKLDTPVFTIHTNVCQFEFRFERDKEYESTL